MGLIETVALKYIYIYMYVYTYIYIVLYEKYRELCSILCDDLQGWDVGWVGGRLEVEGIYVYT